MFEFGYLPSLLELTAGSLVIGFWHVSMSISTPIYEAAGTAIWICVIYIDLWLLPDRIGS